MLAQGMQGGLSGFGTSGLGMFEKGGLLGKDDLDFLDSINDQDKMRDGGELKRSDLQVGDVVTHKKGKGNAHGRIYKITETAFYLEDKFGNKSERAQYFANDFKKVKRLEDGGQISDIERILAKYRDIQSNQPKKDPTQEFLNKSWEGKNLDDYIMYSDRYKRGGEVPSIGDSGTITDKNSMFLGKMATITADLGNMYEVRVGERTTIVKKNGINIVSDQYADGGEVNKYEATFDQLKKGDVVMLKFGSSISRENDVKLIVKSKNLVGKGKTYESEKITFAQVNNPNGVKFYGYKRKSGYIGFASGDMGINVTNISVENKFEDGGVTFIEYKDNEIMYEPTFNKYYANDVEFDTLQEAQKFLDSGEMSDSIRGAYSRGLFEKGGELKKPTWIAIYEKGSKRKVFELNANSREEAKIEAEKGKKQYKIPEEMFLYDVFRKFAHGGEVSSTKNYLYEISTPFPAPILAEELEELFGPGRVILNDWNSPEQLESVIMLNLTQNDIDKIQSNIEDAIFSKSEITDPEEMEMLNHFAKGGEVGKTLDKTEKYWYERIKNSNSKSVATYNLSTNDVLILNRLSSMGLVDKSVIKGTQEATFTFKEKHAKGGEVKGVSIGDDVYAYFDHNYMGYQLVESPSMGEPYEGKVIDIINENNKKKYVVKFENGETKKLSQDIFDDYVVKYAQGGEVGEFAKKNIGKKVRVNFRKEQGVIVGGEGDFVSIEYPTLGFTEGVNVKLEPIYFVEDSKYAKGGKIGFQGLANKVAKRYKGKAVSKEYQAEYGKTYDAKEAKEVGNKVAEKVYKQQVAKKKIVRKLQRKTN
jgi:hypothetical protein